MLNKVQILSDKTGDLLVHTLPDEPYGSNWMRLLPNARFVESELEGVKTCSMEEAIWSADTVFFYWRWYDKSLPLKRIECWQRQTLLLQHLKATGRPYWILNGDLRMTESELREHSGHVVVPQLKLTDGDRQFFYPYDQTAELSDPKLLRCLVYVGTPLHRENQIRYWLSGSRLVHLFGSWSKANLPQNFVPHGRIPQSDVALALQGNITIHLAPPRYYEIGFITNRWNETAAAGCASILPADWLQCGELPDYIRQWVASDAHSANALIETLCASSAAHAANVQDFRTFSRSFLA